LFAEELTQQIPLQSEWLEKEDGGPGPASDFLRPAAQTCSRRLRGFEDDLKGYENVERFHHPTWVPNWDCRSHMDHEPRAIIEIADPARSSKLETTDGSDATLESELDVETYRTWVIGYAPGGRIVPRGTLAIQGRVLGKVARAMSATSLLGRDESMFSELQTQWKQHQDFVAFPLEAHILSLWTKILKQTWLVEQVGVQNVGQLNPELFRRAFFDIGNELSGNPYRRMLEYFDLDTLPPKAGSIEAHLVQRAKMGTDWSADSVASQRIVPAPKSIVDQRLLGLYRAAKLNWRNMTPRDVLLQEMYKARHGADLGPEKLVLLPPEAKFGDLVVVFPGAKVPFLVRSKYVCGMEHWSTQKVHRGNLPRIETAELYVECALVGECWVNGFEEIGREDRVFDTVFSVQ
jgi:hypothetical protein